MLTSIDLSMVSSPSIVHVWGCSASYKSDMELALNQIWKYRPPRGWG